MKRVLSIGSVFAIVSGLLAQERPDYLHSGQRIVFLGDSVTAAGDYVAVIDARLRASFGDDIPELINLGLPSENCTGLSEPEHPFPRPNVHERLQRALDKLEPDVVIACYGMNDGIYYPFDSDRFRKYQEGIRELVAKVNKTGSRCVLLSPPAFDPQPFRKSGKLLPAGADKYAWFAIYEGYARVIQRYADWIRDDSALEAGRINVHDPIRDHLVAKRKIDPEFAMSGDGVHIDRAGHTVLADAVLRAWGIDVSNELPKALVDLCHKRHRILHAAWLSHVGHQRPGMKAGLSIDEAGKQASELEKAIKDQLAAIQ